MEVVVTRDGCDDAPVHVNPGGLVSDLRAAIAAQLGLPDDASWGIRTDADGWLGDDDDSALLDPTLAVVDVRLKPAARARAELRHKLDVATDAALADAADAQFEDAVRELQRLDDGAGGANANVNANANTTTGADADTITDLQRTVTLFVEAGVLGPRGRDVVHDTMYMACTTGGVRVVDALLAGDPSGMVATPIKHHVVWYRLLPMTLAAKSGQLEVCRLLVERGIATGGASDDMLGDALNTAVRGGYLDIVHMLLDAGVDINARGRDDVYGSATVRPLTLRCTRDDDAVLAVYRTLLARGADVMQRGCGDNTPLHIAALEKHVRRARLLLDHGADVNATNKQGNTPIVLGIPNAAVVDLLLEHGADMNVQTRQGDTVLMHMIRHRMPVAAVCARRDDVHVAVADRSGVSTLGIAAMYDEAGVCRAVVERGVDVDTRTPDGRTPLALAASHGHLDVCGVLIALGALVDARCPDGATPLMLAAADGFPDVCAYLVVHGADVHAAMDCGWTAWALAREEKCVQRQLEALGYTPPDASRGDGDEGVAPDTRPAASTGFTAVN